MNKSDRAFVLCWLQFLKSCLCGRWGLIWLPRFVLCKLNKNSQPKIGDTLKLELRIDKNRGVYYY